MAVVRPRIAVTGPQRHAVMPRFLVGLALRLCGAEALQLRPGDTFNSDDFDGVVITGGHDVDPVLYASQPEVVPRYDQERDAFESRMIEIALQRRLPLLGICRGAQLLNVRLGGSLFQELKSRRSKTSNRWTVLPLKTLLLEPGTRLKTLLDCASCRINSLHNQGMDRLGEGLRVSGRDLDGIVQGLEDPDRPFLVGVQWHPEFLFWQRRQMRLFRELVEVARQQLPSEEPLIEDSDDQP